MGVQGPPGVVPDVPGLVVEGEAAELDGGLRVGVAREVPGGGDALRGAGITGARQEPGAGASRGIGIQGRHLREGRSAGPARGPGALIGAHASGLAEAGTLPGPADVAWGHRLRRVYHPRAWRISSGPEVDFVLGDAEIAIERKAKSRVHDGDLKGLREFRRDHRQLRSLVVASLESRARRTDDGILILPCAQVVTRLWGDDWVGRR